MKIHNVETIQPHFTRVSQIKELEAVEEEVENAEVVITTLNGLASQDHRIHSFKECVPKGSD